MKIKSSLSSSSCRLAGPCYSYILAVIETTSLSAYVGTCVEIKCKVTGYLPDEDALWFWIKDGKWDESINNYRGTIVYSNNPTERPISPQFEGRVKYTGSTRLSNRASSSSKPSCSVSICDLREEDSGKYFFRYIVKDQRYKWSINTATLVVTVNPCRITFNKPAPVQEGYRVTLRCFTPRTCACRGHSGSSVSQVVLTFLHNRLTTSQHLFHELSMRCVSADGPKEVRVQADPGLTVKENMSLTLNCSAQSDPPVSSVSWSRVTAGQELRVHTGTVYTVKSVSVNDSGLYSCTAHNPISQGTSPPAEVKVKCERHYGPQAGNNQNKLELKNFI
uniref:B-cell receptor CD22 n=1 Tax=Neogobius melanostomus TaxID=47308 RepID=A0A8C6STA3_9GOBI